MSRGEDCSACIQSRLYKLQVRLSYPRSVWQPVGLVPRGSSKWTDDDECDVQLPDGRRLQTERGREELDRQTASCPHDLRHCQGDVRQPTQSGLPCWVLLRRCTGRHRRLNVLTPRELLCHLLSSSKLNGGLSRLHSADEDAVSWLTNYGK